MDDQQISDEALAAAALAILVRDAAVEAERTASDVSDMVPCDDWQSAWEYAVRHAAGVREARPNECTDVWVHQLKGRLMDLRLRFR